MMFDPLGRSVEKLVPMPPPSRIVAAASVARCMMLPVPWTNESAMSPLIKQLTGETDFIAPMLA